MSSKILIVDDDATLRKTVEQILRQCFYDVITGVDGQEALVKIRDEKPDLVLMDIEMPGMGGREACRIIKTNKSFSFTPVILMTARDDIQLKVEGLEMGADDYLIKPLNALELAARVKSMLRLKALQDELMETNNRLRNVNERLQELSMTDSLTGLYNRLFFQKRITYEYQRAMRYRKPLALLMLDLDHFKKVNDTFGHQFGDYVLHHASSLLAGCVRQVDILARYGGEEIVVACPETDVAKSLIVAERIRTKLESAEFKKDSANTKITASIGISVCPDDRIKDADELLRTADEALYRAKQDGRNCIRIAFNDK
jgi:two-component system, cell cycle response regulator